MKLSALLLTVLALLAPRLLALAAVPAPASPVNQVFQFHHDGVCTLWSDGQPSKASSYLWIPETTRRVRGLLILCANVPEHMLVGNSLIRQVCAANDLAIVWSTPSFMNFRKTPDGKKMQDETATTVAFLHQQLDALAAKSGYAEIATVPWLPIGESGHLLMVDALVEAKPERCIAGVWLKNNHLPPKNRTVPALVVFGSAQEWGQDKSDIRTQWNNIGKTYDGILNQRAKNPDWPLSYVLDGHSGHFDCSERLTTYLARYIDLAVKARLSTDGSPALRPVALSSGYFADLPVPGREGKPVTPATTHAALPWFFDQAQAKEAQAFAAINWQAETQLPVYLDEKGADLPQTFNGITNLKPTAFEDDGLTFSVRGRLADQIPAGFAAAGEKLARTDAPMSVEWLCGPLEPLGGGRFRIALDRVWQGGGATYVALRQPGTTTVRGIVQPAGVDLRAIRPGAGKAQKITFPAPADVPVGTKSIALAATSDAGLPVRYYVRSGPAIIQDGQVVFTALPPRAKFPVEVTVVAWQWGRTGPDPVKFAPLAEQTFRLTAP